MHLDVTRHQIGSLLPAGAPGIEPTQSLRLHAYGSSIALSFSLSCTASGAATWMARGQSDYTFHTLAASTIPPSDSYFLPAG